jgi:hypothetical protein
MTNIGKPYEGKPHVRFDEEELKFSALHSSAEHIDPEGNRWIGRMMSIGVEKWQAAGSRKKIIKN